MRKILIEKILEIGQKKHRNMKKKKRKKSNCKAFCVVRKHN